MSRPCIWPASYKTSCGKAAVQGRLCGEHLRRVQAQAGERGCAWPGCERRSGTKSGLGGFHLAITAGQIEPGLR
ncbi:MAG: hypothetical protein ACRDJK_06400 [Actinomycetota bacterium]